MSKVHPRISVMHTIKVIKTEAKESNRVLVQEAAKIKM